MLNKITTAERILKQKLIGDTLESKITNYINEFIEILNNSLSLTPKKAKRTNFIIYSFYKKNSLDLFSIDKLENDEYYELYTLLLNVLKAKYHQSIENIDRKHIPFSIYRDKKEKILNYWNYKDNRTGKKYKNLNSLQIIDVFCRDNNIAQSKNRGNNMKNINKYIEKNLISIIKV